MARGREIDVILVWRLDRWGRSVTDLIGTLRQKLRVAGYPRGSAKARIGPELPLL
jgi:hypothetical protein